MNCTSFDLQRFKTVCPSDTHGLSVEQRHQNVESLLLCLKRLLCALAHENLTLAPPPAAATATQHVALHWHPSSCKACGEHERCADLTSEQA